MKRRRTFYFVSSAVLAGVVMDVGIYFGLRAAGVWDSEQVIARGPVDVEIRDDIRARQPNVTSCAEIHLGEPGYYSDEGITVDPVNRVGHFRYRKLSDPAVDIQQTISLDADLSSCNPFVRQLIQESIGTIEEIREGLCRDAWLLVNRGTPSELTHGKMTIDAARRYLASDDCKGFQPSQ